MKSKSFRSLLTLSMIQPRIYATMPDDFKRIQRGTQEATRQLANELQVQYEQMDEHFFSHSTTMFLIDQNNQVRALYDMAYRSKPVEIERIVDDVLYLVNKSNE